VGYAPPERLNQPSGGVAADIYSLGAVFYFLLTGHPPFVAESAIATLLKLQQTVPIPLETIRNDIPPEIVTLIHRMMSPNPKDRPASIDEILPILPQSQFPVAPIELVSAELVPLASDTSTSAVLVGQTTASNVPMASATFTSPPTSDDPPVANLMPPVLLGEAASGVGLQRDSVQGDRPDEDHQHPAYGDEHPPESTPFSYNSPHGSDYSFVQHHDETTPVQKRRTQKVTGKSTLMLLLGLALHLIAVGVLLWLLVFRNSSSDTPVQETPKKKSNLPAPPR
jgi:serine/threonine protein kinase